MSPPQRERAIPPTQRGFRTFFILWLAQTVSSMGSQLTAFGLGVWVYQHTHSTTLYSLIALANMGPHVLFVSFVGALADRWDLRRALIAGHLGAGLCSLTIALLFHFGLLNVGVIMGLVAIGAICLSIHSPAFNKLTTLLVPAEQLARANGLAQLGVACGYLVAPLLASILLPHVGLVGILTLDILSFAFAITVIVGTRLAGTAQRPRPDAPAPERTRLAGATFGWRYVSQRPGLLGVLLVNTAMSFNLGMIQVLVTPLVLSFADVRILGIILFACGMGMLAGSVVMMAWGGPSRRIHGIYAFILLQGAFLVISSLAPSAVLVGMGGFGVMFTIPIIQSCSVAIYQRKVPADVQGRVFGFYSAATGASVPVAYLLTGPLADHVFEPLMARGGAPAGTLGRLIGSGPGRGIALLFAVLGLDTLLFLLASVIHRPTRRVEAQLPDSPSDLSQAEPPGAVGEPAAPPLGG